MRLFWKRADFPMAHLVDHPGFLADRSAIWARLRAGGEAAPLGFAWRGGALWLVREWLPGRTAGKATAPRFLSACERLARWESEGILHGDLHAGNLLLNARGVRWIDWDWAWDTRNGPAPWRMNHTGRLSSQGEARDLWLLGRECCPGSVPFTDPGFGSIRELAVFLRERMHASPAPGTEAGRL